LMFTFPVAVGAAPWTRGAFPPIGVLSYGHRWMAVRLGLIVTESLPKYPGY
jgi:hypothetical protein